VLFRVCPPPRKRCATRVLDCFDCSSSFCLPYFFLLLPCLDGEPNYIPIFYVLFVWDSETSSEWHFLFTFSYYHFFHSMTILFLYYFCFLSFLFFLVLFSLFLIYLFIFILFFYPLQHICHFCSYLFLSFRNSCALLFSLPKK